MTEDERRDWLAGLRPGDRVSIKPFGNDDYRQGATLGRRQPPYDWRPDEPRWDLALDFLEQWPDDNLWMCRPESELEPLPFPGMEGVAYVGPTGEERRRRDQQLLRKARRLTPSGTASSARTPGGRALPRTSGGRRSPGRP